MYTYKTPGKDFTVLHVTRGFVTEFSHNLNKSIMKRFTKNIWLRLLQQNISSVHVMCYMTLHGIV